MDPMNGTTPNGVETLSTGTGSSGTGAPEQNPQAAPSVGSSIPQGWTVGAQPNQQQDSPSAASIPQGWTVGEKPGGDSPSNEIQINDNDSLLTKGTKAVGGLLEGVGEGVFSTAAGGTDLLDRVTGQEKGAISKTLHHLAGDDLGGHGTLQSVGYGGETLMEFMLGDEALKGISLAQRLQIVSKWMGIVEKSPKLMQAMRMGADLMKDGKLAEALRNPVVREALKAGGLQGVQTTVRSGGDLGEGARDAALATLTAGATGAVLHGAGKLAARAGSAAKNVLGMSEEAAGAPSEQGVFSALGDKLSQARQSVDDIFTKANDSATGERDAALSSAENARNDALNSATAGRDAATQEADNTLASRKSGMEDMQREHEDQLNADQEGRSKWIEKGLQEAHGQAKGKLLGDLDKLAGEHPADPEELAPKINEGINKYEEAAHTDFEEGINGENGIVSRLEGTSQPVAESKIAEKAGKLLDTPDPNEHPAVIQAMAGAGDKLDARVKDLLENLKNGSTEVDAVGADGKATKVPQEMADWTADSLVKFRQSLRKWAAGYERGDLNRSVLGKLINSVDDSLEHLAEHAGDEGALGDYQKLRETYKQQRSLLDSTVADKLKLNDPDKALNDVNRYLTGGSNSLAKLQTVRAMMGPEAMQDLARTQAGTWRDLADKDPKAFLKEFNAMKAPVRDAFFGPEMAGKLQDLADTYNHTVDYATKTADNLTQAAKDDKSFGTKIGRKLYGNIGPGEKQIGGFVGQGFKAEHATRVAEISDKYNEAVKAAQDTYDSAKAAAKDTYSSASDAAKQKLDEQSAPFKGSFLKNLSEGRINEALRKGDVDLKDIQNLKAAIGDDNWKGIADGIWQRAVADASPKGNFNPESMLKWWEGMKEPVRKEFFNLDDPNTVREYQKVMDQVKDSASVKRMVKWAGIAPAVGGTALAAGAAGGVFIGHFAGLAGEVIGGLTGVAGGGKLAAHFIEWMSNHPNTWKTLMKASDAAASPTAKVAGKAAIGLSAQSAHAARQLYGSVSGTLVGK